MPTGADVVIIGIVAHKEAADGRLVGGAVDHAPEIHNAFLVLTRVTQSDLSR